MAGHIDDIRQNNAGLLYRLIDTCGPVSRIALSRLAPMAPASVTKIIRVLKYAGLIGDTVTETNRLRGRPATGLITVQPSWQFLALHLEERQLKAALCNFSGQIVAASQSALAATDNASLATGILQACQDFFSQYSQCLERIAAITLTLPGVIDSERGVICSAREYPVRDLPLANLIRQKTGLSLLLQQDVRAQALAEYYFGEQAGAKELLYVSISEHIDVAVITGGQLLATAAGNAPQLGYLLSPPEGTAGRECLHRFITRSALASHWQQLAPHQTTGLTPAQILSQLNERLQQGDTAAAALVQDCGRRVAHVLAPLVALFNSEFLLINSPLNPSAGIFCSAVAESLQHCFHENAGLGISVKFAPHFPDFTGAATALVKDALYDGRLLMHLLQG